MNVILRSFCISIYHQGRAGCMPLTRAQAKWCSPADLRINLAPLRKPLSASRCICYQLIREYLTQVFNGQKYIEM